MQHKNIITKRVENTEGTEVKRKKNFKFQTSKGLNRPECIKRKQEINKS